MTASYYKPFVSHMIGEIQTLKDLEELRFIPGHLLPSDLATRSTLTNELTMTERWIEGPEFLKQPEEKWSADLPWIQEATEIRSINESNITLQISKIRTKVWKKMEFYLNAIPSYTEFKGKLSEAIRGCQAKRFLDELRTIATNKPIKTSSTILAFTSITNEKGV